jgi:hypothetical protein
LESNITTSRRAMSWRRSLCFAALAAAVTLSNAQSTKSEATSPGGKSASAPSAATRMAQSGPEEAELRARVGTWDVTATLWPAPGAAPVVTHGLIAERKMIGPILQEVMRPADGSHIPDFQRLDYLNFDRVEGRWKYVSMDTRMPVSIMPAWSFDRGERGKIALQFAPQAFVGFGTQVEGRLMISDLTITSLDADHETKQQRFNMATGDGSPWLFMRYEYARRK